MFLVDLLTGVVGAGLLAALFHGGRVDPLRRWAVASAYLLAFSFAAVLVSAWEWPRGTLWRIPRAAYFFIPTLAVLLCSLHWTARRKARAAAAGWNPRQSSDRFAVAVFFSGVALVYAALLAAIYL
jgi:hypothetical protein